MADPDALAAARLLTKRHFGFDTLRPGQAEALVAALAGDDFLAVLPTGAGKSLCYQLPAFTQPGTTLVVSPLIALMKDQVESLPAPMQAATTAITSALDPGEVRSLTNAVAAGRYRLVYAAPERLRQRSFLRALARGGVARVVVDEAHCVSLWGHDFRPDYLAIGDAVAELAAARPIQVMAFTATAPPHVAADIQKRLSLKRVVRVSIARPNLRLDAVLAKNADEKLAHLVHLAKETPGPGIVYASSRAKVEQIAAALQSAGVNAAAFHAGFHDRAERQEAFMRGAVDVLVATVAFGMGVDKGDIRFVFHHDPPASLEAYWQEAGRAGRDGAPARCALLATPADATTLKQRAKSDLPDRALLETAWGMFTAAAGADGLGTLDAETLDYLDPKSEVRSRLAVSLLEQAGALERLGDVPRGVYVGRATGPLAALANRNASLLDVAAALGVAPVDVEARVTALENDGAVSVSWSAGRDLAFRLVGGADQAVRAVAEQAERAASRSGHVMAYVKDAGCREGVLRRYFGETPDGPCGHCDVCLGVTHDLRETGQQNDEADRAVVLTAVAEVGRIGEANLASMLRGDGRAAPWTHNKVTFGKLAHRAASAVKKLVTGLVDEGLLVRAKMDHGGVVVQLSPTGARAMASGAVPAPPPPPLASTGSGRRASSRGAAKDRPDVALDDAGESRFQALREWRFGLAKEVGVPAYVILPDRSLREIAAADPQTLTDLAKAHGVGPKKLEMFGAEVLALLASKRT